MSSAVEVLRGFERNEEEHPECRTLPVDLPSPSSVEIEFTNLTLKVTEGFRNKSIYSGDVKPSNLDAYLGPFVKEMNQLEKGFTVTTKTGTEKTVQVRIRALICDSPARAMIKATKTILKNVSGLFRSGQLTAIMGPSGAGKSSLMNALTGFSTKGVTGTIRAGDSVCELEENQRSIRTLNQYRKKSCYILQDDRISPFFTVEELMKFAADMKLGTLTEKLKMTVISEVLEDLGMSGTEKTRCGNLSGGQRKRLSIALELLDNPPALFLDEPTTGLDSVTSAQCIEMLKNLARSGRTVVCTVHQPTATVYALFDQVYILADGMCVYHGSSENTVPYLASVGLHCPKYHNPADYMLEIASGEYGNFNEVLAIESSKADWTRAIPQSPAEKREPILCGRNSVAHRPPHELYRFAVLFRRCFLQQYRDWTVTHLKVLCHVLVGVLLGIIFNGSGNDGSKVFSNLGYMMISIVYLLYTSLMPGVLKFPAELTIIKKETFNNWYQLKTYYLALMVTGIPIQIWYSFVYSAPSYFLTEQPQEPARFVMFVLVLSHVTLLADALGNVIGTCVNPINGTFLAAIYSCAMLVFAGYLVLLSHMSWPMQILSHGSFVRYAFEAIILAMYSFNRAPLPCPEDTEYCHMKHPKQLIKQFSFKADNFWFNIGFLFTTLVFLRVVAYLTLHRNIKRSS